MKNNELLNDYSNYIKHSKNISDLSFIHYINVLNEFIEYIGDTKVENLNIDIFEQFFMDTKNKLSKSSKNNYISVIKGFLVYLNERDILESNFINEIKYLKSDYEIKTPFSIKQMKKIFNCLGSDEIGVIILFLYYSGVRVSECTNIELNDVDLHLKTIKINGKGNKQRVVYIYDFLYDFVIYRINNNKKYLFEINKKKIQRQKINLMMKEFEIKNELNFHLYPHKFRRSLATHLIENNLNVKELQEVLGHDSILSTEKYVNLSKSKLKNKVLSAFDM